MKTLEVHTHSYLRGGHYDRSGKWVTELTHSHARGSEYHRHDSLGPAYFTIDKDEWFRATGLRGGGRKKFTAKPTGLQLPLVPRQPGEGEFTVVLCKPTPAAWGTGPGVSLPARMVQTFGMTYDVIDASGESA